MSQETYPAVMSAMIDRVGGLTAAEVDSLGTLWKSDEDLVLPRPSLSLELQGEVDYPVVTNKALVDAWERALDAAGAAGRVRELDAARAGGRAVVHDVRHLRDSAASKDGAEEAVRSAMLAVGVRDLISDDDYQILVSPWQQVLGPI
jgi:hypothetical protein